MPVPSQLHFLERLEAEKSEVHAVQLAQARQALTAAEAQLAQLKQYEGSYHTQLSDKLEHAVTIDTLQGHHRFMQNIAHAVRQQEIEVARRQTVVEAIGRVWQEIERRRQGFRVMADKAARTARLDEERRSQKVSDELSSSKVARTHLGL